jgi:hypothetical protein
VAGLHALDAALPDLGGEHRTEAMPPKPDGLMADLDAALVQKVLDVPQREREPDIEHHRQSDDLGAGLEPFERIGFGYDGMLLGPLPRLKPSSSETTEADTGHSSAGPRSGASCLTSAPMGVRRQGFWDRWLPDLRECLAHLIGLIMRRICGEASAAFRWSFV